MGSCNAQLRLAIPALARASVSTLFAFGNVAFTMRKHFDGVILHHSVKSVLNTVGCCDFSEHRLCSRLQCDHRHCNADLVTVYNRLAVVGSRAFITQHSVKSVLNTVGCCDFSETRPCSRLQCDHRHCNADLATVYNYSKAY